MRALIYLGEGQFELREKEKPGIVEEGAASGTAKDKPSDWKTAENHFTCPSGRVHTSVAHYQSGNQVLAT